MSEVLFSNGCKFYIKLLRSRLAFKCTAFAKRAKKMQRYSFAISSAYLETDSAMSMYRYILHTYTHIKKTYLWNITLYVKNKKKTSLRLSHLSAHIFLCLLCSPLCTRYVNM